jgi:multicomponent Na+:H+ antiporter subunit F
MSGALVLGIAADIALGLLLLALLATFVRLLRGPTLGDRILALDTVTMLAAGMIATMALKTGFALYIDIAIALSLVAFLSTIALARYLLSRAQQKSLSADDPQVEKPR